MHELSIATEIIRIVESEIARRKLGGVTEIVMRLGALSGINPDALSFGFEAGSCGTSLEGCRLDIRWIPVRGACRNCGGEFESGDYVFICPHCGSQDLDVKQGEELEIDHLVAADATDNPIPPDLRDPAGADHEQQDSH